MAVPSPSSEPGDLQEPPQAVHHNILFCKGVKVANMMVPVSSYNDKHHDIPQHGIGNNN